MLNTTINNIYKNGGVLEMRLSQGISCPPTLKKKNGTGSWNNNDNDLTTTSAITHSNFKQKKIINLQKPFLSSVLITEGGLNMPIFRYR